MSADPLTLTRLRSRIAALEGIGRETVAGVVPLGATRLDRALPWGGLPRGCLHEVAPVADGVGAPVIEAPAIEDGAATAFAAALLGRLAADRARPVLWVGGREDLYAPGLAALGLPPERLLVVRALKPAQALWAIEEAVRCPGLAAVLAETRGLDFTAARRLQLAAGQSGVTLVALNRGPPVGVAVTRWKVATAPSLGGEGVGAWRWRVALARCRGRGLGEGEGEWVVEWDDATRDFRLAAAAADRPAAAGVRAAG